MKNNNLSGLIDEALENIRNDRRSAQEFLNEIANQIAMDAEQNRSLSPVAAKHVETMQRSNEHRYNKKIKMYPLSFLTKTRINFLI